MKTTAFAAVAILAVLATVASANPGCCGPKQLEELTIGFSSVRQNPPPGNLQGAVNMMMYFDYNAEVSAMFVNNFTHSFELYTQGGAIKRSFLYLPSFNICTNITYKASILEQQQLCVGAGTDHPNFASAITLGRSLTTESWGSTDGHQFINVNPTGCVITAVNQYDDPTQGGTMLGVYYNVTASVQDVRVFDIPSACTSSTLDVLAQQSPRKLQDVTTLMNTAKSTFSDIMSVHQSI